MCYFGISIYTPAPGSWTSQVNGPLNVWTSRAEWLTLGLGLLPGKAPFWSYTWAVNTFISWTAPGSLKVKFLREIHHPCRGAYKPCTYEVKVKVAKSCPTLGDPMDYTVHGILQARILEWVAISFSSGSSKPRDWTQVSCFAGGFFTCWAVREARVHTVQYISFQEARLCDLPPGEEVEHNLPSKSARYTLSWSPLLSCNETTALTFITVGYFFLFLFNSKWHPHILNESRMSEGLPQWC